MTDIAAVIERVSDEDEDYIGSGVLIRAADRDALLAHIAELEVRIKSLIGRAMDADRQTAELLIWGKDAEAHADRAEATAGSLRNALAAAEAKLDAARAEAARLREALTPSAATKAAYINGFQFIFPAFNEAGDEVAFTPNVPWTTIKEIMAAIRARAALDGPATEGDGK